MDVRVGWAAGVVVATLGVTGAIVDAGDGVGCAEIGWLAAAGGVGVGLATLEIKGAGGVGWGGGGWAQAAARARQIAAQAGRAVAGKRAMLCASRAIGLISVCCVRFMRQWGMVRFVSLDYSRIDAWGVNWQVRIRERRGR